MLDLAKATRETRAWACYDCGKCTATCPISRTGGDYSPRRHVVAANAKDSEEYLDRATLFGCLTCSQCDSRCPAEVGYTDLVQKLRELGHQEGLEPECPHGGALHSIMRMMAKGGPQQNRLAWLNGGLKTEKEQGEVFFWTGCTMYFDALFPEFDAKTLEGTKAAIKLLNRLGVTPVVSKEERCCGHDLLWNGDRANFEALARFNVDLVAKSGAKTLVTPCAECVRTWKVDYEPYFKGRAPKVVHLSEFLAENLPKLKLKSNGIGKVTYQDPCRLGRHLGIYEAPREVLRALPETEFVEMRRHAKGAICCAGGTWSNCDKWAKQIQVDRLKEARTTGADVMVAACPKCQIHFNCAMKDPDLEKEITIQMRDLAELVAERLDNEE